MEDQKHQCSTNVAQPDNSSGWEMHDQLPENEVLDTQGRGRG